MTAAPLTEQEPPADPPAEAQPVADAAPLVVNPPVEPETVDELRVAYARVRVDNEAMAVRIAQLEAAPEERWMLLKPGAAACRQPYEHVRRLAEANEIRARGEIKPGRTRGCWWIDVNSVDRYQQRVSAK